MQNLPHDTDIIIISLDYDGEFICFNDKLHGHLFITITYLWKYAAREFTFTCIKRENHDLKVNFGDTKEQL